MTYLKQRSDVINVFGKYTIAADSVTVDGTNISGESIYDYLIRDKGKESIQAKILRSEKSVSAVSSPLTYLDDKKKDLVAITENLRKSVKDIFERYLNRNMPIKEAREKTKKDLDTKFLQLMKDHEEDFPKSDTSRAIKKLTGN